MKISARNVLPGEIVRLVPGAVNCEVQIRTPGGAVIVSIITRESAEQLGLAEGGKVFAVIKASDVMIGVDH